MSVLDVTPVKGVTFSFGNVVSAIITFLITGFVLFLVVKAANSAKDLHKTEEEVLDEPTAEQYLSDIRDLLAQQVAEDNGRSTLQAKVEDESTTK